MLFFIPGVLDLWFWPSNSSERGTKDVLHVNLSEISSAIPEISAENAVFCPCWPWPLPIDLDIQTRPSEGSNTSSVWIWRKSIRRFSRYFIRKQKSHRPCQKQNLTQLTACGNELAKASWKANHTAQKAQQNVSRLQRNESARTCIYLGCNRA